MLPATTACNFSSLIWPAGSTPAALASLLFDPRSPKSLEKQSVSRLSYLFSHLHLLSSYSFSSTLLSSNLSLLSASSLLCFSSVHIVGSLTSKLPSIIYRSLSFTIIHCHSLSFIVINCRSSSLSFMITDNHSLSFIIIAYSLCIQTRCLSSFRSSSAWQ